MSCADVHTSPKSRSSAPGRRALIWTGGCLIASRAGYWLRTFGGEPDTEADECRAGELFQALADASP